jgi:ABC-type multidrug transport system fused ATPase/permease subunit
MSAFIQDIRYLFNRQDLLRFALIVLLMIGSTLLELASLGAVPLFVAMLAANMAGDTPPVWSQRLLELLGLDAGVNLPLLGGLALALLFVCRTLYLIAVIYLQERLLHNRQVALSGRLFRAYMRAPYAYHLRHHSSGMLNSCFGECERVVLLLLNPFLTSIRNGVVVAAIVLMLLFYDPLISLGTFVFLGLCVGLYVRLTTRRIKVLGDRAHHYREEVIKTLNEGFAVFKEARLLGRSDFFCKRQHRGMENLTECSRAHTVLQKSMWPMMEMITVAALLGTMCVMLWQNRPMAEVVPTIALITVCLARMKGSVTELMIHFSSMRFNRGVLGQLCRELRELESEGLVELGKNTAAAPAKFSRDIVAEDLHFSYEGAMKPAIDGVSLRIARGSSVALVGATGSGKSTLADLLLGMLLPQQGRVLVDGSDIHEQLGAWQRQIGYVPQSINLLDDSLQANVALGIAEEEIDRDALWAALSAAQLAEWVREQPAGLLTELGERGVRLSGGQRQRIGIARALYHRPTVLIFDEATSALDLGTERALVEAIEGLRRSHTVILIAHRLNSVRSCDQLFFFEKGRLLDQGPYDELLARLPAFRAMVRAGSGETTIAPPVESPSAP